MKRISHAERNVLFFVVTGRMFIPEARTFWCLDWSKAAVPLLRKQLVGLQCRVWPIVSICGIKRPSHTSVKEREAVLGEVRMTNTDKL